MISLRAIGVFIFGLTTFSSGCARESLVSDTTTRLPDDQPKQALPILPEGTFFPGTTIRPEFG